ncbi:MAG: hypothetical protein ACR2MT_05050 [Aurantibacter sp.]
MKIKENNQNPINKISTRLNYQLAYANSPKGAVWNAIRRYR